MLHPHVERLASLNRAAWTIVLPSWSHLLRATIDGIIVCGSLALAFVLRYAWAVTYELDQPDIAPHQLMQVYIDNFLNVAWVLAAILVTVFTMSDCYGQARIFNTRLKALMLVQAVSFSFVLTGMLAFLGPGWLDMPRSVLMMAGAIAIVLFLASRLWSAIWRYVLRTEGSAPPGTNERIVLVIGGAGYIGSALIPKLLNEGYRVRVIDLFLYGIDPIAEFMEHPRLETIRADFRQTDALVKALRGVDTVVHLGGIVGDPACAVDEELTIDVNLAATRLIAEAAKGYGVKRFVFASTCSVYGASDQMLDEESELNPLSLYARSKIASEKVLHKLVDEDFALTIVRFGTIYGLSGRTRFDLVVNLLAAKAMFDGEITVFGGDQWRPFVHVDDAARAVNMLLRLPNGGKAETFNVGGNKENYTIENVGEIVARHVPNAKLLCSEGDQDKRNYRVNFSKIERMIGFRPRWTVDDGVHQVIDEIRAGRVTDYRDAQYSNAAFMGEACRAGLKPPEARWAHQLIAAAPAPSADVVPHPVASQAS